MLGSRRSTEKFRPGAWAAGTSIGRTRGEHGNSTKGPAKRERVSGKKKAT